MPAHRPPSLSLTSLASIRCISSPTNSDNSRDRGVLKSCGQGSAGPHRTPPSWERALTLSCMGQCLSCFLRVTG